MLPTVARHALWLAAAVALTLLWEPAGLAVGVWWAVSLNTTT